eukprot:scaffold116644_cov30-Phaeocystis_antarctica.AAC.1
MVLHRPHRLVRDRPPGLAQRQRASGRAAGLGCLGGLRSLLGLLGLLGLDRPERRGARPESRPEAILG